ncbi:MAG TPA: nicotinate-nucleotide adenylyltransferase [Acidimicrobiales bacterium]|nr:nicotinate-nucleotide adenylyltransferase [Acidimicrobiales bacterium]
MSVPRPLRLGILGGTFDPVHIGHLVTAVDVRHALGLDRVLLVVANEPWQKVGSRAVTPAADRLAVVEAAVAGVPGLEASAVEIERGGPTYTADTLATLAERHPGVDLHLVLGADVAAELGTWVRIEEVRARCRLVLVGRPGFASPAERLRAEGWRVESVAVPALEVSSTGIRERVATGAPIDFLVPTGAIRVIGERGLYAARR